MKVPAAIGVALPQSNVAKTLAACDVSPQLRYGPMLLRVLARGSMLFGERVRPATSGKYTYQFARSRADLRFI